MRKLIEGPMISEFTLVGVHHVVIGRVSHFTP